MRLGDRLELVRCAYEISQYGEKRGLVVDRQHTRPTRLGSRGSINTGHLDHRTIVIGRRSDQGAGIPVKSVLADLACEKQQRCFDPPAEVLRIAEIELGEDRVDVAFHCPRRDPELLGDSGVAPALRDAGENLLLTNSQLIEARVLALSIGCHSRSTIRESMTDRPSATSRTARLTSRRC